MGRTGRNQPCPCGSGKKYKKCCMVNDRGAPPQPTSFADVARKMARDFPAIGPLPPYVIARMVESPRYRPAGSEAALGMQPGERWTIGKVSGMSTEDIEGRLVALGVRHTRDRFLALAEGRRSAWSIADAWQTEDGIRPVGPDADFLGLAACELYRRIVRRPPSIEMIDDLMQEGYTASESGELAQACRTWWAVWEALVGLCGPDTREMADLDEVFSGMQCAFNWCQDFEEVLSNVMLEDRSMSEMGRHFCEQWIARFPGESPSTQVNFRRSLARFLFFEQRIDEGVAVLEDTAARYPEEMWAYVALADTWAGFWRGDPGPPPDLERARRWLDLAVERVPADRLDMEVIRDRLKALEG